MGRICVDSCFARNAFGSSQLHVCANASLKRAMWMQHKRHWSCAKLLGWFTRAVRQGTESTQFLLYSWQRHYMWRYYGSRTPPSNPVKDKQTNTQTLQKQTSISSSTRPCQWTLLAGSMMQNFSEISIHQSMLQFSSPYFMCVCSILTTSVSYIQLKVL